MGQTRLNAIDQGIDGMRLIPRRLEGAYYLYFRGRFGHGAKR